MFETMNEIFSRTGSHLYYGITLYLPPLFVAFVILLLSWLIAHAARFAVSRLVKGKAADHFLKSSGFSNLVLSEGTLRTGPLVARAVFWLFLLGGLLCAISVFDTQWTQRMVENIVLLFPKALTAGVILIAGLWLSLYLSRSILLWASDERLPAPRRWASAVRVIVMFTAIVVAADVLNFAPAVFFAAFIILVGGAVLASALAFGLGGQHAVRKWISGGAPSSTHVESTEEDEAALWRHL
ncbi:MAG: hypothetical protein ABI972_19115 [Acidobacteriota bacterium]